jgi:hypothetical protein
MILKKVNNKAHTKKEKEQRYDNNNVKTGKEIDPEKREK